MSANSTRIWDLATRLFHWALVICVSGAIVSIKMGGEWTSYHFLFGYAVVALITFRLVWGFIGPKHARFSQFIKGPKTIINSLRQTTQTAGHSPLGALSVLLLLASFGAQAVGGLFSNDDSFTEGPLAWHISKELSDLISSYHRQADVFLMAIVVLHILAIIYYRVFKHKSLVMPMITGDKLNTHLPKATQASRDGWGTRLSALVIFAIICYGLYLLINWQPSFSY